MTVMLATDVCRVILRQQPQTLLNRLQSLSSASNPVVISAVTYAELVAAALQTEERSRHMELVDAFCDRLDDIVPWDSGAVQAYSDIQQQALNGGYTVNMNDAMIAAHAISLDAVLLTGTPQVFSRVKELRTEGWD